MEKIRGRKIMNRFEKTDLISGISYVRCYHYFSDGSLPEMRNIYTLFSNGQEQFPNAEKRIKGIAKRMIYMNTNFFA